jgi:hypothetical protein
LERIWSAHGILIVPYIEARIKIITNLRAQQKSPHTREDARTLENMIVLCWKRSRWDTTPWLHCKITTFLRFRIPSETKKSCLTRWMVGFYVFSESRTFILLCRMHKSILLTTFYCCLANFLRS